MKHHNQAALWRYLNVGKAVVERIQAAAIVVGKLEDLAEGNKVLLRRTPFSRHYRAHIVAVPTQPGEVRGENWAAVVERDRRVLQQLPVKPLPGFRIVSERIHVRKSIALDAGVCWASRARSCPVRSSQRPDSNASSRSKTPATGARSSCESMETPGANGF